MLYKNIKNVTGGATMLVSNGHVWYAKRKAASPAFSSNHIRRMLNVAVQKTDEWINTSLRNDGGNDGVSFDVAHEMLWIVLSALSETAFEYNMTKQETETIREDIGLALREFVKRSPTNPFRQRLGYFFPERHQAWHHVQSLRTTIQNIMNKYRNTDNHIDGTMIQLIMESNAFPTETEKIAQLTEFLLAGHDTTAYTISWILLCLAKHPHEQSKLREELSKLPPESWPNCEHLQRVIKEGMRLYPVARSGNVYFLEYAPFCLAQYIATWSSQTLLFLST